MLLTVTREEGRRNDVLLWLERDEIENALLSVANRDRLMALPGIPRHRSASADEAAGLSASRIPIEAHLQRLGIVSAAGPVDRPAIAISNRNLGTNHGHVAWQRTETPHIFHVLEDPIDRTSYSCLTVRRSQSISIEDLRFDFGRQRVFDANGGRDVSDEIEWAAFGPRVLRDGHVPRIDEIVDQFYDIRHVLAFDPHTSAGQAIQRDIYRGYPVSFRENVVDAWRTGGVPRARYFHNAMGLSRDALIILQREGTVEEIGDALKTAGAEDGLILDNGGSVACWLWWANAYRGGILSPTVDYRPDGTSAIAFVLKGPARVDLPGGSVSFSTY
jgi:hypothetical protein